jgi:hypothetical protein
VFFKRIYFSQHHTDARALHAFEGRLLLQTPAVKYVCLKEHSSNMCTIYLLVVMMLRQTHYVYVVRSTLQDSYVRVSVVCFLHRRV